jgi:hypothetical protein
MLCISVSGSDLSGARRLGLRREFRLAEVPGGQPVEARRMFSVRLKH